MTEPANSTPSATEEVAAAPGWVEQAVDEIFADPSVGLKPGPGLRGLRNAYLDCLAGAGRGSDVDVTHDRCRRRLLTALAERERVSPEVGLRLEQRLEAIEMELSARI